MDKKVTDTRLRDLQEIYMGEEPMGRVALDHFVYGVAFGEDKLRVSFQFDLLQTAPGQIDRIHELAKTHEVEFEFKSSKNFVVTDIKEEHMSVALIQGMNNTGRIRVEYRDSTQPPYQDGEYMVFDCYDY